MSACTEYDANALQDKSLEDLEADKDLFNFLIDKSCETVEDE